MKIRGLEREGQCRFRVQWTIESLPVQPLRECAQLTAGYGALLRERMVEASLEESPPAVCQCRRRRGECSRWWTTLGLRLHSVQGLKGRRCRHRDRRLRPLIF